MTPDASTHNPDPSYLRSVLKRSGLTQEQAATRLGLSPRQMRYYLSLAADHQDAPYLAQFGLECLAVQYRTRAPDREPGEVEGGGGDAVLDRQI